MLPLLFRRGQQAPTYIELTSIQLKIFFAFVIGLWLFTFIPLLNFPFLSDDYVFLKWYRPFWRGSGTPEFFRPLYNLIFWLLANISGGSPQLFHIANYLLHLTNSILIYTLVYRFQRSKTPAIICFTVFLLNPLQLEASLWISGMQELLWAFFVLAALKCYTGKKELSSKRIIATLILIICALLCKETAVCIILLLPLFDLVYFKMKRGPYLLAIYISVIVLLLAYIFLRRIYAITPGTDFFSMPDLFFVKQLLSTPYRFFTLPLNTVTVNLPVWIPLIISIFIAGLLFVTIVYRRASIRLLFGPLIIIISTLPVFKGFFVSADLFSARYIYFAAFGWALFLVYLLSIIKIHKVLLSTIIGLALLLTWTLHLNIIPWRTAGSIALDIRRSICLGNNPQSIISEWMKRKGKALEIKNGVPIQYQGVSIFLNGYSEMLKLVNSGFFCR
jgi:hypothetical protein